MQATRNQEFAQRAFQCIEESNHADDDKYASFAKSFPALVQSCGLCQAVAFAESKDHIEFLKDLINVLSQSEPGSVDTFARQVREMPVISYLQLSRDALAAATWIKRYVEALEA